MKQTILTLKIYPNLRTIFLSTTQELFDKYKNKFVCVFNRVVPIINNFGEIECLTVGWYFNQPLNNLANIIELKLINPNELFINNLPNLYYKLILFNLQYNVINLPININEIITNEKSLKYIKNIPYGCTVNLIN